MRDFESTPIFQYDGPPERRKQLESLGRVYLGIVKGALGGDLPFAKHAVRLPDGTIISATSIRNSGVVDIIRVHVPQEARRVKKGAHLETEMKSVERIVPILDVGPCESGYPNDDADNVYLFWPTIEFGEGWEYFSRGNDKNPERIYDVTFQSEDVKVELIDFEMQYLKYYDHSGQPE